MRVLETIKRGIGKVFNRQSEASGIIEAVIIIIIIAAVAVIFKGNITTLLSNVWATVTTTVTGLFS